MKIRNTKKRKKEKKEYIYKTNRKMVKQKTKKTGMNVFETPRLLCFFEEFELDATTDRERSGGFGKGNKHIAILCSICNSES